MPDLHLPPHLEAERAQRRAQGATAFGVQLEPGTLTPTAEGSDVMPVVRFLYQGRPGEPVPAVALVLTPEQWGAFRTMLDRALNDALKAAADMNRERRQGPGGCHQHVVP